MNVLLTCAGRRTYMVDYFRAAVAPYGGRVYAANSEPSAALCVADRAILMPGVFDPTYAEALLDVCRRYDIRLIVPLYDLELPVLAATRDRLRDVGVTALVSSPETVAICNDKWRTAAFLADSGIRTPRTYLSIEAATKGLEDRELTFPLIVKPRFGMGSIGLARIDTADELTSCVDSVLRSIERSYLSLLRDVPPREAVVIQECARGEEYCIDVVNDLDGRYQVTFAKRKLAKRAGETDTALTVDSDLLSALGRRISACLEHVGILDADIIVDEGVPTVLEMNPRFGGAYPFSHLAGADVPSSLVAWVMGEEPEAAWLTIAGGVTGHKGILPCVMVDPALDLRAGSAEAQHE